MKLCNIGVSLVAAGALSLASGAALANTYNLDIDHCTNGCFAGTLPFGTVTVTQDGTSLDYTVQLNDSYTFQNNGQGFDQFAFGFTDTPGAITILTSGFTNGPSPTKQDGFGQFQEGISATTAGLQTLQFTVANESLANLAFSTNPPGNDSVLFAADILSPNGNTGNVGGSTLVAGVPEPSTWAMMLLGFAGLGFAFRQSRRKVSFA